MRAAELELRQRLERFGEGDLHRDEPVAPAHLNTQQDDAEGPQTDGRGKTSADLNSPQHQNAKPDAIAAAKTCHEAALDGSDSGRRQG